MDFSYDLKLDVVLSMADRKWKPIPDDRANIRHFRHGGCPSIFLRLSGMRKVRESADERRDREGVYS